MMEDEAEAAKLRMLEARKALEDHEELKGTAGSSEYTRVTKAFAKATRDYLALSKFER